MLGLPHKSIFASEVQVGERTIPGNQLKWSVFHDFPAGQMYSVMQEWVFPFIKNLHADKDSAYAKYMGDAIFKIPTPLMLDKIVTTMDEIYDQADKLHDADVRGDIYEYLLSKIATAGVNGQFRTPRHIIRMMVDIGEEKGAIQAGEKEMIENIFEFDNMTAGDVMIHRTDMVMLWVDDTAEEIAQTIESSGLSRFPVYEEDADDIIGILNTRDWLLNARKASPRPVRELLRPAYFVPESVRTDKLFRDMQSRKIHLSIVVDEYGGTAGLVTMEDLLEEIVGNIYDEFDPQEDQEIIALGDNRWRIAGSAELDDVAEALDMEFPEDEESETLGGLVFAQLNVIPEDGSHPEVELYGLHIRVEELTDRRVEWATVTKLAPSEPKENAE